MTMQVPFIDRKEQLQIIETAINDKGKRRVIYFQAGGGIGKTRLLQEVRNRFRRWDLAFLTKESPRKNLTIAVVNEFLHTAWADRFLFGIETAASEMGIQIHLLDANYDIEKMADEITSAVKESPDAIIVRLGTDEKVRSEIENAARAHIPVLTVDNYLPRLSGLTSSITTDEHLGAYQSSEQLVKDINFRGKVIALSAGGVAMQEKRKNLLASLLSQYSNNIELLVEQIELNSEMEKTAYERTIELLNRHPDTKAIWVTWDEFTRGVVHGLRDLKRTDIGIYSFDLLSPEDVELMAEADSPWKSTVTIDPMVVGRTAIELAVTAACMKPVEKHYSIPMQYVTQEEIRNKKERWLSIWDHFDGELRSRVLIPEIIDFDEFIYRMGGQQSIEVRLADLIGPQHFNEFFLVLKQYNEVKEAHLSDEIINKYDILVQKTFRECLKKITEQQRVILLIDTAEKAREDLRSIIDIISEIDDIVVILAGRPDKNTASLLKDALGDELQVFQLPPFKKIASKQYLKEKQKILNVVLEPELASKLLYLADGKPILIDLAIEWRARNDPLDWLVEKSLIDLKELPLEEHEKLKEEFESQLVRHIVSTRTKMDLLTLLLAQVYPLDANMMAILLDIPQEEADKLARDSQNYVFIKVLPNGKISLHDEMRRLVATYAWPEVDMDENWRHSISKSAAIYLQKQIEDYAQRLEKIREDGHKEKETQELYIPIDLYKWRAYHDYAEEIWMLKEHLLRHLLVVDQDAGKKLFISMFDEATGNYRYTPRLEWVALVEAHGNNLSDKDKCDVFIRKSKALLDNGKFNEARQTLENTIALAKEPEQNVDLHIQLANVLIRQGDLTGGIQAFEKATEISQQNDLKRWLVKAENGLGWAYRLTADLDSALAHYETALGLAIELNLTHEQALLYNNLGFISAYMKDVPGYYDTALRYCNESLRLAQELGDKRGVGRAYSALGSISFMAGNSTQALEYFQKGLEIFEPTNDEEWMGIIYSWRGAVYISGTYKNLSLAEKDLQRARDINITKEQPMVLSRLGLIYLLEGKLDEAQEVINECSRLAYELPDDSYQWVSIRDKARLARYKKDYHLLDKLENMMKDYLKRNSKPDGRAWGMLHMELGNLAMGLGQDERAAEHYHQGMRILTAIGNYGADTPIIYLERLESEIFKDNLALPVERIRSIGVQLLAKWQAEKLHIRYPDVRAVYSHWANFEEVEI